MAPACGLVESLELDLKHEEAPAILDRLLAKADVLIRPVIRFDTTTSGTVHCFVCHLSFPVGDTAATQQASAGSSTA